MRSISLSRICIKRRAISYKYFAPNGASEMLADLSHYHEPITLLFKRVANSADCHQYRLTNDQVEFFHANGYLADIRALNDEQIAALRHDLTELIDPSHPGHK